jgi:hypothetical protein
MLILPHPRAFHIGDPFIAVAQAFDADILNPLVWHSAGELAAEPALLVTHRQVSGSKPRLTRQFDDRF